MNIFSTFRPNRLKISGPEWAAAVPCVLKLTFLPPEVFERPDLWTDEDVQFGWKEVQNVDKALISGT
jgi:hypothetical protein